MWQDPKVDWSKDDNYNFGDLDRVEENCAHLATMLSEYSGKTISIATVIDRDATRFEFYDSMNRIESNIQTLADNFYEPVGWETPVTNRVPGEKHKFNYTDANRLEKNLYLLYNLLTKVLDSMQYCGTFACGEEGI